MKHRDYLVVRALREKQKPESIDGWGFSGPGALLFEEVLDHPELYGRIIGVMELDPIFEKQIAYPIKKHLLKSSVFLESVMININNF